MVPEGTSSSFDREVREQVRRYLRGELTVGQLHKWLEPRLWDPYAIGDRAAAKLVGALALRLGEYATAYWSEDQLRTALRVLVGPAAGND